MKKIIYLITLSILFLSSSLSAEQNLKSIQNRGANGAEKNVSADVGKFKVYVFGTRQDNVNFDWWYKVPSNKSLISGATKGWLGDKIHFIILIGGATKKDNDDYEIKLNISAGRKDEIKKIGEKSLNGKLPNARAVYIATIGLDFIFEESDKFGPYIVKIEAVNVKSGEKSISEAECTYEVWKSPPLLDERKAGEAFVNYNSSFDPIMLYQIFMSGKKNSMRQFGPWQGINPSTYSFFKHAFSMHKFLLPILRKEFKNATDVQREKIIMLFSFLDEKPFDIEELSPNEVVLQTQTRKSTEKIKNSDPYKEIKQPADLDLLWGEFFALGNYKSAKRILEVLLVKGDREFAEAVLEGKKINPSNPEEIKRLFLAMVPISAEWSILSNLRNRLFNSYMSWAYTKDMSPQLRAACDDFFKRAKDKKIKSPAAFKKKKASSANGEVKGESANQKNAN